MGKSNRKVPSLNSSSMADISFLMLIFFLVTSSMDTDTGLARRLPQPPQSETETKMDVERRNLMVVMVNKDDQTMAKNMASEEWYSNNAEMVGKGGKPSLKDKIKEFVMNSHNSTDLPELVEEDFGPPIGVVPFTKNHVISLQNDATTSYKAYIAVQNELVKAYNEMRQEAARKYFNTDYVNLTEEQQTQINEIYRQRISEAEPKNYGGDK